MMKLSKSIRLNESLLTIGISTPLDAVMHLPYRYNDFSPTAETKLTHNQRVVIVGRMSGIPRNNPRPGRKSYIEFSFTSKGGHYFKVIAFNQSYLLKALRPEDDYTLVGKYNGINNTVYLTNLKAQVFGSEAYLQPVYSLPKAISDHVFRQLVKRVYADAVSEMIDLIPEELSGKYRLISKAEALYRVHFPKNKDDLYQGLRVLKYEEALLFSLKTALIRKENKYLRKTGKKKIEMDKVDGFIKRLPYSLTIDQAASVKEIICDMAGTGLMYRLLQGDVGSGKTLVAAIALYANYLREEQGALMAPTDTLAKQHFTTLKKLFEGTGITLGLLVGGLTGSERERVKEGLLDGVIDVIVGTHALFSDDIVYQSMGLAVIDEQHRFGVNQRTTLANKGREADLLLLSATPIPRTLALTLYGEMDITSLHQFPFSKRKVTTLIVKDEDTIHQAIAFALADRRQSFIVAPMIVEGDSGHAVEELYDEYCALYGNKAAILHGKMASEDKDRIIADFASGRVPILVSTTVIEVGIDVPGAALMAIYDPERFGLATLHQLRGRIGRDGRAGTCYLFYDGDDEGKKRLEVLTKSDDGFAIAEQDLEFRGPGDMIGERQAGFPQFSFVNVLSDFKMLEIARDDARELLTRQNRQKLKIIDLAASGIDKRMHG